MARPLPPRVPRRRLGLVGVCVSVPAAAAAGLSGASVSGAAASTGACSRSGLRRRNQLNGKRNPLCQRARLPEGAQRSTAGIGQEHVSRVPPVAACAASAPNAAHLAPGRPGRRATRACPEARLWGVASISVREQRGEAALQAQGSSLDLALDQGAASPRRRPRSKPNRYRWPPPMDTRAKRACPVFRPKCTAFRASEDGSAKRCHPMQVLSCGATCLRDAMRTSCC